LRGPWGPLDCVGRGENCSFTSVSVGRNSFLFTMTAPSYYSIGGATSYDCLKLETVAIILVKNVK
jgi:hypothetical protein